MPALSPDTSAVAACRAIRQRDVSVQELTSRFLAQIDAGNGTIGAVRHILHDQANDAARAMDARIQSGAPLPPLAGLPVIIKENCDTIGALCSAGLSFRARRVASSDAAITARLRAAGAIVLGLSVSDPGAFGARTPQVTHPLNPALTVGGSSGGAAASLAAGFCLGAIGTDTGGSIRIPSACCGTAGLKPSYGNLPMNGIFPLVTSLDHVGPMSRSVADLSLLWQALANKPPAPAIRLRRIGYDPAWVASTDQPTQAAFWLGVEKLKNLGMTAVEINLPNLNDVIVMHGRIFLVEAASYHCAHHEADIGSYPTLAREWFAAARTMPVGDYVDACAKRIAMTRDIDRVLDTIDAIMTPTLCVAPPAKDAATISIAGVDHEFTMGLVRLTCLFNHTGHPAVSFPIGGASDQLTPSLQLVGKRRSETTILQLAHSIGECPVYP